jgi:hypothetical protein
MDDPQVITQHNAAELYAECAGYRAKKLCTTRLFRIRAPVRIELRGKLRLIEPDNAVCDAAGTLYVALSDHGEPYPLSPYYVASHYEAL